MCWFFKFEYVCKNRDIMNIKLILMIEKEVIKIVKEYVKDKG